MLQISNFSFSSPTLPTLGSSFPKMRSQVTSCCLFAPWIIKTIIHRIQPLTHIRFPCPKNHITMIPKLNQYLCHFNHKARIHSVIELLALRRTSGSIAIRFTRHVKPGAVLAKSGTGRMSWAATSEREWVAPERGLGRIDALGCAPSPFLRSFRARMQDGRSKT